MWVYIDYPVPHVTVHGDPLCTFVQNPRTPNRRIRVITSATLGQFLTELIDRQLNFAATSGLNDVWLHIELDTPEQERGLVHVVQALLGQRYRPLARAPISVHCD